MDIQIITADYANPAHARAVVDLLDAYACDPMGGSEPLCDDVRAELIPGLAAQPNAMSLLAFVGDSPIGLSNCFFAFSTFMAKPLINIHDVIVLPKYRGQGVARALFAEIERIANKRGACKVTLEVLSGNTRAKRLYASLGYGDYTLDPESGTALFWQKRLAA